LEEVTFADPTHAAAQYLLGACRFRLNQHDRAVERFAVAAALLPRDLRTFRAWGQAEVNARRPDRAVKVYDLSLKRVEGVELGADFRYQRGTARLGMKEFVGAADDFTIAIRSGVRPVASHLGRAAAREATGDRVGAAADRRAVALLTPNSAAEWGERAKAAEASDPTAARRDYEQAVAAGASFPEPYIGLLTLVLDHPGDPTVARRVAEDAAARFPHRADFHAARALALARSGRGTDARLAAADVGRLDPGPLDAFRVGAALAQSLDPSDHSEALRWLRLAYLSGYPDVARLDTWGDFSQLRATAHYQALRSAIEEMKRK
jgi:tetratricopeptide (TPR) repeat protein